MSLKNVKLQMSLKNSLNLNYFGGVCSKQKKSCEYLNFLWLSSAYLLWVIGAKFVVRASCILYLPSVIQKLPISDQSFPKYA